jgi:hypothetical protein
VARFKFKFKKTKRKKLHFGGSLYSAVVDAGLSQDWSRAETHFENRSEPFSFGQQMLPMSIISIQHSKKEHK